MPATYRFPSSLHPSVRPSCSQFAFPAGRTVLVFDELVSLLAITQDPLYTEMVDKLPLLHVLAASMPQLRSTPVALHNRKVRGSSFCWPSEGAYAIAFYPLISFESLSMQGPFLSLPCHSFPK